MKNFKILMILFLVNNCALIPDPDFDRISKKNCEVSCETHDTLYLDYSKKSGCFCSSKK